MENINTKERDHERARAIAHDGCIIRSLVGSTVHGLANAGTDDRDEMGVCIEPREYVLGLRPFEHFVYRTQPEGHPSGPGDLDLTIYGLRKYARLALKGSPTALLLLFVEEPALISRTGLGRRLQELAPAFVCRRAGRAFMGYVESQRRGLVSGSGGNRTRELSRTHGYDTKYAMHALRIAFQGSELMTSGRISLPVPEPQRSELMSVRRGEVPMDEVVERLEAAVAELEHAVAAADVPADPDRDAVDRFLVEAYEEAWGGHL